MLYQAITILLKMYAKSSTIDASLYSLRYMYLVSVFTITSMLLYVMPMRDSFNINSLIIKLRAINDHIYSSNVEVYSFL